MLNHTRLNIWSFLFAHGWGEKTLTWLPTCFCNFTPSQFPTIVIIIPCGGGFFHTKARRGLTGWVHIKFIFSRLEFFFGYTSLPKDPSWAWCWCAVVLSALFSLSIRARNRPPPRQWLFEREKNISFFLSFPPVWKDEQVLWGERAPLCNLSIWKPRLGGVTWKFGGGLIGSKRDQQRPQ